MNSTIAARIIRSHGIDAWSTDDPDVVLAMDVSTERLPGGIVTRCEPVLLDPSTIREWLGY